MNRLWFLLIPVLLCACSSIDCPVNNVVETTYVTYDSEGNELVLSGDTLAVLSFRSDGQDTLLLNRQTGSSTFHLPISYSHPEDVLFFCFYNDSIFVVDTVWVKKDDYPHFESVDCSAVFFHTLTGVRYTTHAIDSIVINNPTVDYDNTTVHFRYYPKSGL